jgi:hypothetical protein
MIINRLFGGTTARLPPAATAKEPRRGARELLRPPPEPASRGAQAPGPVHPRGSGVIGMSELIEAARREYEKGGQTWQPGGAC